MQLSRSAQKQIKSLASQMFNFAMQNDIVNKNYAEFVELKPEERKEKEIFSDTEIKKLWDNKNIPNVDTILILIYTGMRVGELLSLTKFNVDMENQLIKHGNKTEAGKNRIIPIHANLIPFFKARMKSNSEYVFLKGNSKMSVDYYRKFIYYRLLEQLEIKRLSPHSCRHTFSSLLNRNVSNKVLIQKLMGHTDYSLTANVYTHTDIEELKKAVGNIKYTISL